MGDPMDGLYMSRREEGPTSTRGLTFQIISSMDAPVLYSCMHAFHVSSQRAGRDMIQTDIESESDQSTFHHSHLLTYKAHTDGDAKHKSCRSESQAAGNGWRK